MPREIDDFYKSRHYERNRKKRAALWFAIILMIAILSLLGFAVYRML